MNIVKITASGKVGCGKSAVLGEIEIALKAVGLKVEWVEGAAEKGLTHADWIPELEMYQPTVVLSEKIEAAAPTAQGDAKDAERYRYIRDTGTLDAAVWAALEGYGCADEGDIDQAAYAAGMDQAIDAAIAAKAAS